MRTTVVGATLLMLVQAQALADPVIQAVPANASIAPGASVDVAITISNMAGLSSGGEALGAFDIDIAYDPAVLSLVTVTFGNQLDLGILGSIPGNAPLALGLEDIFEVSLESPSDLATFQADAFVLVTLRFDAVANGGSNIFLTVDALGDESGIPFDFDVTLASGLTGPGRVGQSFLLSSVAVPEPSVDALFGFGVAVWVVRRARRRPLSFR